jgi:hypothetical protein
MNPIVSSILGWLTLKTLDGLTTRLNGIVPLDKEYNFTLVKSATGPFTTVWKYILTIDGVEIFRENHDCSGMNTTEKDTVFRGCHFSWRLTRKIYDTKSGSVDCETFEIVRDGRVVFSGIVPR